ncbi:hypothetical protein [Kitasatospora sp. NPDC087314]
MAGGAEEELEAAAAIVGVEVVQRVDEREVVLGDEDAQFLLDLARHGAG